MPMDVEFIVLDLLEAIQPKVALLKNIEDVVNTVDEMFASTIQGSGHRSPCFQFVDLILTLS
jgi:hypothetical protein